MSIFLCPYLMRIWLNCIVVEWKLISTEYCKIFAKILSATFILCQHFTVVVCMSTCGGSDHKQTSFDLHGLALRDMHLKFLN
jgi:hypothetical protein